MVIPGQFLAELNKLPDSVINFPDAVHKVRCCILIPSNASILTGQLMEAKYTKVDPDEPLAAYSIKAALNPALCTAQYPLV